MKFDAHVSNVGFILYLVAQVIPEPQRANQSFVPRFFMIQSHYPHLHTPRDRLTDIMNSYLLLICISFVPATVSICATLPLWFSKHMQNRIIRLSGLTVLSLIMAGGLFFAFACQNPWFGLSSPWAALISSCSGNMNCYYRHCAAPSAIIFHCISSPSKTTLTSWHAATADFIKNGRNKKQSALKAVRFRHATPAVKI